MLNIRSKLKKVATITAYLAITITFASCNKEDTPKGDMFLLEEVLLLGSGDIGRLVFEYDSHERIIKYSYYYNSELPSYVHSLTYNADGDLVTFTQTYFEELSFYPDRTTNFIKRDNIVYTSYGGTIELNAQGLPIKYLSGGREETLVWQNENLIKTDLVQGISSPPYQTTSTFTYDNMKSPFYHCKTPKWFFIWYMNALYGHWNVNNMIGHKLIFNDGEIWDYQYNYTYNDNEFPATLKPQQTVTTSIFRYLKR
jgi:hypothetical protein